MALHHIITYTMNNSSVFADNLLLSPLLRQRDLSPFLSPFQAQSRRLSEDMAQLIDFNLEESRIHVPEGNISRDDSAEEQKIQFQEVKIEEEESQEVNQQHPPPQPHREDLPSTKIEELSEEKEHLMLSLPHEPNHLPPIESLINYLILHSKLPEQRIMHQSHRLFPTDDALREVFQILARKFRKLRKTKQQMVKYCIRKAFKYVTELTKKSTKTRDLDYSMRQYFAEDGTCSFSIPFKKNSQEKTMNGCFLRRIFSCPRFTSDYQRFVTDFRQLMLEDNRRKVSYLAELIRQAVAQGTPGKVERIKRLPWTIQILQETNQLAVDLGQNKGEGIGRRRR